MAVFAFQVWLVFMNKAFIQHCDVVIKSSILFLGLIFSYSSFASTWVLTEKSNVGFHIDSMGMRIVTGQFNRVQSTLNFDPESPQTAYTEFIMVVNSLSIDRSSLKNMIMGKDLFYASKYPTATFKSTAFKSMGQDKYQILGWLTLRGMSKAVTFNATLKPSKRNVKWMDFNGSTQIKRHDFGMKKAVGGVGEKVNIQVSGQWEIQ